MFNEQEKDEVNDVEVNDEANDNHDEINTDTEGEAAKETEGGEQRQSESPEQRTARLKRQVEREAKKAGVSVEEYLGISRKEGEGSGQKGQSKEVNEEKYQRLALKVEGYTDKAEQDALIKYAEFRQMDVVDVVKDSVAQAIIKGIRDKAATPSPSSRTGKGATNSVDALVARYKAGKYLSPDEMKQVRKKLRG